MAQQKNFSPKLSAPTPSTVARTAASTGKNTSTTPAHDTSKLPAPIAANTPVDTVKSPANTSIKLPTDDTTDSPINNTADTPGATIPAAATIIPAAATTISATTTTIPAAAIIIPAAATTTPAATTPAATTTPAAATTQPPTTPVIAAPMNTAGGTPAAQVTIPTLPARLAAARAHLISCGGYLADPTTLTRCEWIRDGKCHRLVYKPQRALEDANELTLAVPQLAELSIVGRISKDDFWLLSDAGWRGPTDFSKIFAKVKASGCWEMPSEAPFAVDFPVALNALRTLEKKMVTPGFTESRSVTVGLGGSRIKVKHTLFEPRQVSQEEEEEVASEVEADIIEEDQARQPKPLTLENWPVRSDEAKAALEEMKGKYYVVPIPAYDMHGDLIHPSSYRRRLEGALAALRFNLTHWAIKGKGSPGNDTYVADIVNIRVLSPPLPTPVTPRKRGVVPAFDPTSPRPTNKTRRLWE